jgi:succinate-semialdehyde dehydrogenase/glutarate-semialdehyde dehydrogenase
MLQSVNPATGKPLRTYPDHDLEACLRRLDTALRALEGWRGLPFAERAAPLRRAADLLAERKGRYARLMAEEMGKPIAAAEAEIHKCAWNCRHYADHAERYLAPEEIPTDARRSLIRFDPLGVVLAIMPWNFPFWQVFRFSAPALMAGNAALLKHASNVPGCALAIEEIWRDAGLPPGLFQTLLIGAGPVEALLADPRVAAVTLTGSEAAGAKVAAAAGRHLKKCVLELGGSDPFVVFADADLEGALSTAVQARCSNAGQSCIAAKRFVVHERVAPAFEAELAKRFDALRVGDPLDRATQVGPLAREDLVADIERQVRESVARGARLVTGGRRLDRPGFYYAPTVLADVRRGMPAADEETFGPAAAILTFRGEDEAVRIANDTPYGLGASLWTRDEARIARLVPKIEAGSVFVNGQVKSDPRLPFGGVKRSGFGRELGREGIREFVNVKTVWMG